MNQKSLEIASKVLNIPIEELKNNYKILDEDNATYFWQTTHGGNSIIVSENGSYLTATSSVSFERHLSEFRKGRRNNS
jgi:hypothetical protein